MSLKFFKVICQECITLPAQFRTIQNTRSNEIKQLNTKHRLKSFMNNYFTTISFTNKTTKNMLCRFQLTVNLHIILFFSDYLNCEIICLFCNLEIDFSQYFFNTSLQIAARPSPLCACFLFLQFFAMESCSVRNAVCSQTSTRAVGPFSLQLVDFY